MNEIISLAKASGCGGQADRVMQHMLAGESTDQDNAAILQAIASRRTSDDELASMLGVMRKFMMPVKWSQDAVDVCGTGGDGLCTLNISTAAAFVAAAAGATVAKHGNRSSSGGAGSAEVFERLGVDITGCPVESMLETHRICFMFAPRYHRAVKNVAAARRILGIRTVFNTLGPLCNPAGVPYQLVGVSDRSMVERMPRILAGCGSRRVVCVTSGEGADELLPVSSNVVCTYIDGTYDTFRISPEDLGIDRADISSVLLNDQDPLKAFIEAISGTAHADVAHTVAMNAGAGLFAAGLAGDMKEGFANALHTIKSGRTEKLLRRFVGEYGNADLLECS